MAYPLTRLAFVCSQGQFNLSSALEAYDFFSKYPDGTLNYEGRTVADSEHKVVVFIRAQRQLNDIRTMAFNRRQQIAQGYDSEERYGWAEKRRLAQACLDGDQEAVDDLQIECTARGDGLSPEQLAQGILSKAKKFRAAELFIRGAQSRLERETESAESVSEIEVIQSGLDDAFDLSKLPELLASNGA